MKKYLLILIALFSFFLMPQVHAASGNFTSVEPTLARNGSWVASYGCPPNAFENNEYCRWPTGIPQFDDLGFRLGGSYNLFTAGNQYALNFTFVSGGKQIPLDNVTCTYMLSTDNGSTFTSSYSCSLAYNSSDPNGSGDYYHNVSVVMTPPNNISPNMIRISLKLNTTVNLGNQHLFVYKKYDLTSYSSNTDVAVVNEQKKTNEKIDEIKDALTDETELPDGSCKGLFCNLRKMVNGIINLPTNIVSFLIDALKSLIVPSEQDLKNIITSMQEPVSELGFVGEILDYGMQLIMIPLNLASGSELPVFNLGDWCFPSPGTGTVCLARNVVWNMNEWKNNEAISLLLTTVRLYTGYLIVLAFIKRWQFQSILDLIKNAKHSSVGGREARVMVRGDY